MSILARGGCSTSQGAGVDGNDRSALRADATGTGNLTTDHTKGPAPYSGGPSPTLEARMFNTYHDSILRNLSRQPAAPAAELITAAPAVCSLQFEQNDTPEPMKRALPAENRCDDSHANLSTDRRRYGTSRVTKGAVQGCTISLTSRQPGAKHRLPGLVIRTLIPTTIL